MSMKLHSIQIGSCYLDRFGVIYEVKAIEKEEQITVSIHVLTNGGGQSTQQITMPMAKFLQDLQCQVQYPDNNAPT